MNLHNLHESYLENSSRNSSVFALDIELSDNSFGDNDTSEALNPFRDDHLTDSDCAEEGQAADISTSHRDCASVASLNVLEELALIDEGLRGIGSSALQSNLSQSHCYRTAQKSPENPSTRQYPGRYQSAKSISMYPRPLKPHDNGPVGINGLRGHSDSLVVHCSTSAYSPSSTTSTYQGSSTAAAGRGCEVGYDQPSGSRLLPQPPPLFPTLPREMPAINRKALPDAAAPSKRRENTFPGSWLPSAPSSSGKLPLHHHSSMFPAHNPQNQKASLSQNVQRNQPSDDGMRPDNSCINSDVMDPSLVCSVAQCEACGKHGNDKTFCNICEMVFCVACWDVFPPHRKRRGISGNVHEQTDYATTMKVRDALAPRLAHDELEQRFLDDANTAWFGVFRQEGELPLFREYERYAVLMDHLKATRAELSRQSSKPLRPEQQHGVLYPSLVSFVGETGAGKSTLIKLLVDLNSCEGESFQTPVVGAVGCELATSDGVHLYIDPWSTRDAKISRPILYADCEGLNGGGRDPVGANWRERCEKSSQDTSGNGSKTVLPKHVSQRPLIWADSEQTQARDFSVAHLYPRLLYTFSDVVVFVVKNPRVIENVPEQLLHWAETALEKSSNQPTLPCAIIALNASENSTPEELWDADHATIQLMVALSEAVHHNLIFKRHAQLWQERGRQVVTVEQLVGSYYKSLRVVRIPTAGRPNLIKKQMQSLFFEIREGCGITQRRKRTLRTLLDADGLAGYLQFAFDHFAHSLDAPFDFVQASFACSPIPMSFGGNILKLAIQVMEVWKDKARAETIFEELSYIVGSCIMIDAARNKLKGSPRQVFARYLKHLDGALEKFCNKHWPCEYADPKGQRCINVRSGHHKGHQLKSGDVLSKSDYRSSFSFETYRDVFTLDVYLTFHALMREAQKSTDAGLSELQAVLPIHRKIVQAFFRHASRWQPDQFVSHTTCFFCLKAVPEHVLPCGHVICTLCLETSGAKCGDSVDICECPIAPKDCQFQTAWTVRFKPENCGIRVLSLDGGGVRGLATLELMKEIERQLGGDLDIRSFFDLMIGTNSGGIIALGLASSDWKLQQCSEQFEALCQRVFAQRLGPNLPVFGKLVQFFSGAKYDTQALSQHLQDIFTDHRTLFSAQRNDSDAPAPRIAVTAMSSSGQAVVLANYNRLCREALPYHFLRAETPQEQFRTWEAAHATFAAPSYFKPLRHCASQQMFSGSSAAFRNPIGIIEREKNLVWPNLANEEPDLVLSIGTASHESTYKELNQLQRLVKATQKSQPYPRKQEISKYLLPTEPEESSWMEYFCGRAPADDLGRYIRLTASSREALPQLDDMAGGVRLRHETAVFKRHAHIVQHIVRRLVASCFYFDIISGPTEHKTTKSTLYGTVDLQWYEVRGILRCRLTTKANVTGLGNFIQRNAVANHNPYFMIDNDDYHFFNDISRSNLGEEVQKVELSSEIVERMRNEGLFRLTDPLCIRSASRSANSRISLCYDPDSPFLISRFPRPLHSEQASPLGRIPETTPRSAAQWTSRPCGKKRRVGLWAQLADGERLESADLIERYCSDGHFLGRASHLVSIWGRAVGDNVEPCLDASPHADTALPSSAQKLGRGGVTGDPSANVIHPRICTVTSEHVPDRAEEPGNRSRAENQELPFHGSHLDMGSEEDLFDTSFEVRPLELMGNPVYEMLGV